MEGLKTHKTIYCKTDAVCKMCIRARARRSVGLVRGAGTGGTGPRTRTGSLVGGAATGGLVLGRPDRADALELLSTKPAQPYLVEYSRSQASAVRWNSPHWAKLANLGHHA